VIRRVPFLLAWPPRRYAAQVLIPGLIFVLAGARVTPRLIAHELAHVDQIQRLGWVHYVVRYVTLLARYGYWNHPMEIEARGMEVNERQLTRARRVIAGGAE